MVVLDQQIVVFLVTLVVFVPVAFSLVLVVFLVVQSLSIIATPTPGRTGTTRVGDACFVVVLVVVVVVDPAAAKDGAPARAADTIKALRALVFIIVAR